MVGREKYVGTGSLVGPTDTEIAKKMYAQMRASDVRLLWFELTPVDNVAKSADVLARRRGGQIE